ncbi:hypothetical protein Emtol_1078 [Emticicia oligotrophica DSM 17448]|uniref:Uncharacterized protein n=1 Tax=Emticicia oligotrophica (strain DSM 17448 / CIP 109782 / MTCC 6937 / GPTSA100-15) TaxID=929562 RepID=A0ABM5MYN2_EMTOG|nr:hypothetical protein Emtol_1078 [Emticicia oligotrophica DSM 17448]
MCNYSVSQALFIFLQILLRRDENFDVSKVEMKPQYKYSLRKISNPLVETFNASNEWIICFNDSYLAIPASATKVNKAA